MKIRNLKIRNWRSIKKLQIEARDLMVVIGQNNHGKSNLLSAVLFFFGEIKHQDLDFHHSSKNLYVEIKFGDLSERDRSTFKKYLTSDGEISVRKTAFLGGAFEYRGFTENPREDWLQEENAKAYKKRDVAKALPFYHFLPTDGRLETKQIIDAQHAFITENRQKLKFDYSLETSNFLGDKNVAKGIFGEIYFIPAIKEATDDFTSKDTSTFGRLYSSVIQIMSETNSDWEDTKSRVSQLFCSLNKLDTDGNENSDRPEQLSEFENELTKELSYWGAKIEVEVQPPNIENLLKTNTHVWVHDDVRTDITRKGQGLQRQLTVALIRVLANRSQEKSKSNGPQNSNRKASDSRYFIFEEPELFLHPQAQRSFFDSLAGLAESGNQVMLCTHSSALIDINRYQSIYIISKECPEKGSQVTQCSEVLFDGRDNQNFNLSYWINPDRGELFFATKVILVEGPTDKTIIPLIAKKLKIFRYDYTIVDCGTKENIPLYIKLLNAFRISYVAVYDRDHQRGKSIQAIEAADATSKKIESAIIREIGANVVFDNDIEEEIGLSGGYRSKPIKALTHISQEHWVATCNLNEKVRRVYDAPTC